MKEIDLQNSVVEYLEYTRMLFTCTLGGVFLGRSNWKQKKMLSKHYSKGVPDVLILVLQVSDIIGIKTILLKQKKQN